MKTLISKFFIFTILINFSACTAILYPERQSQETSEKLDAKVVALDGIGLIFFIIPGVISYAIDFNNGTIYLPDEKHHKAKIDNLNIKNMLAVQIDKERLNFKTIESIISAEAGACEIIDISKAQAYKMGPNGKKIKIS